MKAKEARRILRERDSLLSRAAEAVRRVADVEARWDSLRDRKGLTGREREAAEDAVDRAIVALSSAKLRFEVAVVAEAALAPDLAATEAEWALAVGNKGRLDAKIEAEKAKFLRAEERLRVVAQVEEARKAAPPPLSPENVEGLKWLRRACYGAKTVEEKQIEQEEAESAAIEAEEKARKDPVRISLPQPRNEMGVK